MQHIDFPQDVNSEPYSEIEAALFQMLITDGSDQLSEKQAAWLIGACRSLEWEPQGAAYAIALARRGGPNLEPFAAPDAEVFAEADRVFDEAVAGLLRITGGLQ